MTEQFFDKELAARKIEAIPGLMEFDIPVRGDNRGWFKENFQKEKMLPLGFPESFFAEGKLQNNISFSRKNVLRGLHAEPWDKYISVADEGKVLGTWVDLREGDSFGNTYQTVIDASKGIFVPRGVANGFQVLTDKVAYTYLVNDYWALELKICFCQLCRPKPRYPMGKLGRSRSLRSRQEPPIAQRRQTPKSRRFVRMNFAQQYRDCKERYKRVSALVKTRFPQGIL